MDVDAVIVGGGVTGLWLRALLKSEGRTVVLIESDALGSGQTIASQGILHNGAKYSAQRDKADELLSVLPAMSFAWHQHLTGENVPDLRGTTVVTRESWYWNPDGALTDCIGRWWDDFHPSNSGVAPPSVVLSGMNGAARRNNECVITPASLLENLAGDDRRDLLHVPRENVLWSLSTPAQVEAVTLVHPRRDTRLVLHPHRVYLAAGEGNEALLHAVGCPGQSMMQRRPLRIALLRGDLPRFCGHWFDDDGPRLTISSQIDNARRTIWQLGGRLSEGNEWESVNVFLTRARCELTAGLPGIELRGVEWSCYRAVRAEPVSDQGGLPAIHDGMSLQGNVVATWPIKLSLVPSVMLNLRRALDRDESPDQRDSQAA